ncbi:jg24074 [Pararge aegeria aegeria]|uniref:Jg24074 protein n=1 Tax=Pararge aegeria aegeria TaxID=348720 RepID=A0A8S4RHD4_9NEOP|nr:jg24074 [Pararge aegeria aegeria]
MCVSGAMHNFGNLYRLVETNEVPWFPSDTIQNLRRPVLTPVVYRPNIQQTLQRINFTFHRPCSISNLIQECNLAEGQTLLIFRGSRSSDSRVTMSMSVSSCSSLQMPPSANILNSTVNRDKDFRTTAQQTDISCRSPEIGSPVHLTESDEQRLIRERIADSLTFSSPASSLLQPTRRSLSILGSVCALLLKKQVIARLARLLLQDQDQDQDWERKTKTKTKTRCIGARPRPRLAKSRLVLAFGQH